MKKILVLGSTGSIGTSALDLARRHKDRFAVAGLQANSSKEELRSLAAEFNCPSTLTSQDGVDGIARLLDAAKPDIVVNGIAGAAGLLPSKMAVERGIDLALANKETVVMAWPLIKAEAQKSGAQIIPVDSEHSAIFNLIHFCGAKNISEIVITASGGPFRSLPRERLESVTIDDALKHPTWKMGKKITVDSATLANKGLEVILVRTSDGILYAQISEPDMRHPIMGALCWPEYVESGLEKFSLAGRSMSFFEPRRDDFPLLAIAEDAAKKRGAETIAFNAADEVAAHAFIDKKIKFLDIARAVQKTLAADWSQAPRDFDDVFEADKKARSIAEAAL